jgi:hypothetical protein
MSRRGVCEKLKYLQVRVRVGNTEMGVMVGCGTLGWSSAETSHQGGVGGRRWRWTSRCGMVRASCSQEWDKGHFMVGPQATSRRARLTEMCHPGRLSFLLLCSETIHVSATEPVRQMQRHTLASIRHKKSMLSTSPTTGRSTRPRRPYPHPSHPHIHPPTLLAPSSLPLLPPLGRSRRTRL